MTRAALHALVESIDERDIVRKPTFEEMEPFFEEVEMLPDEAEAIEELEAAIARGYKFYTFEEVEARRAADQADAARSFSASASASRTNAGM